MNDKIEIVFLQSTQFQEFILSMCVKMQYNKIPLLGDIFKKQ